MSSSRFARPTERDERNVLALAKAKERDSIARQTAVEIPFLRVKADPECRVTESPSQKSCADSQ